MGPFLWAMGIVTLGGMASLAVCRSPRPATWLGAGTAVAGCSVGLITAIRVLMAGVPATLRLSLNLPYGLSLVEIDPLSAFFLLPILGLALLSAIYGAKYMMAYRDRKNLGWHWLFFNLLVVSMAMLLLARNALPFLIFWEIMALSSFFLVAFEYEKQKVRRAAWTYLVACHLGTAFLLPMFLLLGSDSGSLDFSTFSGSLTPYRASVCLILGLIGFGTKAGIMPFHVWLPESHPVAPSHVSALMSGVMIKTGIYGILRMLTFLGPPPVWWGWMFVALGATSGVCGVLFALAQHDLKRLLAYHSVENIGIIVIGIGVGLTGLSAGSPAVAALGFAGALLHVINHAMFKGLLFLGAGSVYHGTHTLEIDRLGGLIKRMPWTASFFLVGAAAISGLPPLNGFVSEFLIYLGSFRGTVSLAAAGVVPLVCSIAALGLIGGLAAACFTKAFGIVFLGEPRASEAGEARESPRSMIVPMGVLAAGCLAVGLLGPWVISATYYPIAALAGNDAGGDIVQASASLRWVVTGSIVLIGLAALCAGVRYLLLRGRQVSSTVTWDCGYAAPSPRMQYTASSFAQPIMDLFRFFLRTTKHTKPLEAYFPASSHMDTETPDTWHEEMYRPLFAAARRLLSRLRVLQHGRIQIYVLYVVITLFVLLVWTLR